MTLITKHCAHVAPRQQFALPHGRVLSRVFFRVEVAWTDTRQRHVHAGTYIQRDRKREREEKSEKDNVYACLSHPPCA